MMHNIAIVDIAPTPFQARVVSLPFAWDLMLDGGRGGARTELGSILTARPTNDDFRQ